MPASLLNIRLSIPVQDYLFSPSSRFSYSETFPKTEAKETAHIQHHQ